MGGFQGGSQLDPHGAVTHGGFQGLSIGPPWCCDVWEVSGGSLSDYRDFSSMVYNNICMKKLCCVNYR